MAEHFLAQSAAAKAPAGIIGHVNEAAGCKKGWLMSVFDAAPEGVR